MDFIASLLIEVFTIALGVAIGLQIHDKIKQR